MATRQRAASVLLLPALGTLALCFMTTAAQVTSEVAPGGCAACDMTELENRVEHCAEMLAESNEGKGQTLSEGLGELVAGDEAENKEEEAVLLHYGFFLMTLLLVAGFLGGYALELKHFTYIHEAGGHLLIGIAAGLTLSLMFGLEEGEEGQHEMVKVAKFDTEFFFLLLLPPIIFEAGYNMQRRKFFSNLAGICTFAFIGTMVSTLLIAMTVYYVSQSTGSVRRGDSAFFSATSDGRPFNGLEACIFGALISATDPVTVLAVFGAMGADLDLFSLVFGESVLNDAVAIVLYKAIDGFNPSKCGVGKDGKHYEVVCPLESHSREACASVFKADGSPACLFLAESEGIMDHAMAREHQANNRTEVEFICSPADCAVTGASVANAVVNFVVIFLGSVAVGSTIALFSALLYKHTKMYEEEFEHIEMILLVLFPYMAWMMAEALQFSGIVSILFCGILMAHYTTHNLHPRTEAFSRRFFKTLAFGCESFVFIYMGLATFTYEQDWSHWPIMIVAMIAMLISRLFNVYPNAWLTNLSRKPDKKIPMSFQHIMWFSGLRGAIAFALALQAAEDYAVRPGPTPQPGGGLCILSTTLIIVIFTVLSMGGSIYTVLNYFDTPECSVFESGPSSAPEPEPDEEKEEEVATDKATGFDRQYFKPVFTWRYQDPTQSTEGARDPRWSATNKSGMIPETEARVDDDDTPPSQGVDDGERSTLLTTSV